MAESELTQNLRFFLLAMTAAVVVVLVLALLAPFDVQLQAVYDHTQGEYILFDRVGGERLIQQDVGTSLTPGEGIRLEAESAGNIELWEGGDAFAFLTGPAEWTLRQAERRGTAVDHISGRSDEYTIVIQQNVGTVVYDLSDADPPFDTVDLRLLFPDGEFRPTSECFQAAAPAQDRTSAVVEVPCWDERRSIPSGQPARLP